MPREPMTNPIAFAAGEAIASGAGVALIMWEVDGVVQYRTVPGNSHAILRGMHELLAMAIDAMAEPDDEEDGEGE